MDMESKMSNPNQSKRTSLSLAAITLAAYSSYGLAAPAKPVIAWLPDTATTNDINVHWDMWWGENGNYWKLIQNGNNVFEAEIAISTKSVM